MLPIAYNGTAPDLGAYETGTSDGIQPITRTPSSATLSTRKVIIGGHLYILHNGARYTPTGILQQ